MRETPSDDPGWATRFVYLTQFFRGPDDAASKSDITVCCAHPAYQIHDELVARNSGVRSFQVRERDEFDAMPRPSAEPDETDLFHLLLPSFGALLVGYKPVDEGNSVSR
jgi:hypothetical protein